MPHSQKCPSCSLTVCYGKIVNMQIKTVMQYTSAKRSKYYYSRNPDSHLSLLLSGGLLCLDQFAKLLCVCVLSNRLLLFFFVNRHIDAYTVEVWTLKSVAHVFVTRVLRVSAYKVSLIQWYRLLTRMHLFQIDFQLVSGKINAKNTWVLPDYMHSQSQPLEQAANVTYWYHIGLVPNSIVITHWVLAAL